MAGGRWRKAVKGAQDLLEFIKKDHKTPEKINLVIIFFNEVARIVYDGLLT